MDRSRGVALEINTTKKKTDSLGGFKMTRRQVKKIEKSYFVFL